MNILVTGGTGFVGSNIVKVLAKSGHQIISLDITNPDDMIHRYLGSYESSVTWKQCDILDKASLSKVSAEYEIDKIIHAAVYTGTRDDIEKADTYRIVDINIKGTLNLLDLARERKVKRFMYVSSGGVYAGERRADEPLRETMHLFPINIYDICKYACEMLTKRYGTLHSLDTVSVRLSAPYGPMERITGHRAVMSLVYEWTNLAFKRMPIDKSRISPDRDFTYVVDTASAIYTVLNAPVLKHDVYNIGRGHKVTHDELVSAIKKVFPYATFTGSSSADTEQLKPAFGRGPMDVSRLHELGFTPEHDIESGLREYLSWMANAQS